MAKEELSMVERIKGRLSSVDRNKFMSSAYMMSLAGGKSRVVSPENDLPKGHPEGLYAKIIEEARQGVSLADASSKRVPATVAAVNTDTGTAIEGDIVY